MEVSNRYEALSSKVNYIGSAKVKYGVITQDHDKASEKTVYTQEEGDEEVESPVGECCCHQLV